ncbi:DUF2690 domain-containing protein [Kitasatospora sp. NPDC048538]|uniref:XRE family transcriptional regulator n=1 Tax=unclassified Kitasatospora TaxID=2633591 RepID=UPI0033E44F7D
MGSAWKNLPEELSEPARDLAGELRTIKDAAGLSLAELATRTHYSRASWERWLNGKRVITQQALEALIGTVDCDGPALRSLWERAVAAPGAGAPAPATTSAADAPDGGPAAGQPADPDPAPEEPGSGSASGSGLSLSVLCGPTPTATGPTGSAPAESDAVAPVVAELPDVAAPAVEADPVRPPAAWWRRPATLLTAAAVVAALLVLVGVRAATRHDEPTAAAEPAPTSSIAPTASASSASPAKPASAPPACQAVGCAHKDPKTTGCGKDARTLQTDVIGKVVVYLRYSQTCQAAWAAITEGEPNDYATITDSTGDSETALIHWGYDNYSSMLNAADPHTGFVVCGYQPAGHVCTTAISDLAAVVASTPIPIGPASPPPGTGAGAASTDPAPAATDPGATAQPSGTPGAASPSAASPDPGQSR